jgi:hypothetical protein
MSLQIFQYFLDAFSEQFYKRLESNFKRVNTIQTPQEVQCSQIANYATEAKQDWAGYSQRIP